MTDEPQQGWLLEDEQRSVATSQWYSPPDLAARLWHFAPKPRTGVPFRVLEPAAGKGALILPMLTGAIVPTQIVAYDVDVKNVLSLLELAEKTTNVEIIVRHRDFLAETDPGEFDLAVQNPPFEKSGAADFVLHSLKFAQRTVGVFPASLPYSNGRASSLWRHVDIRRQAILPRYKFGGEHSPMIDFCALDLELRARPRRPGEPTTHTTEWWL